MKYNKLLFFSILLMTFYTAPLFNYCPIRFSDIGCLALLLLSIKLDHKIIITPNSIAAMLFILWCIIDSILLISSSTFSASNHYTQFIRLFFAVLLFLFLPNLWENISIASIVSVLKQILFVHLIIQICYCIIYYCGITDIFNIVSSGEDRGNLIINNNRFFNHFFIINTASGIPRFSGVFEEPAWFGWNLNLIIAIILQYQYTFRKQILKFSEYILIFCAYSLTLSVSAIGCLILIIGAYYFLSAKKNKLKLILSFILFWVISFFSIRFLLLDRIEKIITGADGSSNFRLIGSWNSLMTVLSNDPFTGYGLGDSNKEIYHILHSNDFCDLTITISDMVILDQHNMFFQVICSLGIIGGLLFCIFLHGLSLKKSGIILLGILCTFFSVNVFNTFFFFTSLSIMIYYWGYQPRNLQ